MKQSELAECDSDLVYRVVELLFKEWGEGATRLKMEAIAEQVEEEFGQNLELTRESLYPLVEEAVRRGFVRLTPPVSRAFRDKLVAKFPVLAGTKVNVVETTGPADNAKVAAVAADKAFAAKNDIDLIVTAMGDFNDPHDLLSLFLKDSGQDLKALRRRGWLGNVQYRPFTASGPVQEAPDELRAVTVFELADLVERANDRTKEVILMARQCGLCGRAHAGALRALLSNTNLKVFSRLVLDRISAVTLLK